MKRYIWKLFFWISALAFFCSLGYIVFKRAVNERAREQLRANIREAQAAQVQDVLVENYPADYVPDPRFMKIYTQNQEIVGWISLPGTELDYPVFQHKGEGGSPADEDDFYCRRGIDKEYAEEGIPYADRRANLKKPSKNIVLYGHNMGGASTTQFAALKGFNKYDRSCGNDKKKALAFYQAHPVLIFDSVYSKELSKYKVFAVFIMDGERTCDFQYDRYVEAADDFNEFLNQVKNRSLLDINLDVNTSDSFLTLSTCSYELASGKLRLAVIARRVRSDEEPLTASAAETRKNPLMPNCWYQVYGGSPPAMEIKDYRVSASKASASLGFDLPLGVDDIRSSKRQKHFLGTAATCSEKTNSPMSCVGGAAKKPWRSPAATDKARVRAAVPEQQMQNEAGGRASASKASASLDSDLPFDSLENEKITALVNGKRVTCAPLPLVAALTQKEVGENFPVAAIAAQAIVCHSNLLFHTKKGRVPEWTILRAPAARVRKIVARVLNYGVFYQGAIANTTCFSCSAGLTNDSEEIWNFECPYLVSVESPYDNLSRHFLKEVHFTREEIVRRFKGRMHLNLEESNLPPGEWFQVLSWTRGGYNHRMTVANHNEFFAPPPYSRFLPLTGHRIRQYVLPEIGSSAFTVLYDEVRDDFTFYSHGWGHGVGFSQEGAKYYAEKEGRGVLWILNHYFPGTEVRAIYT
ncbi:MAG: SpoIID/LytB domain-containing protein [Oscillospiraceae bacterium]|jgi:sortase B|nr:SpoIID/LytB domain-containing protein [Oscillospiraceae bacterium]